MLIYCTKCFTGYEIDEDLIRDKSRKVKCSNCGDVFDAGNLVEKVVDNNFDENEKYSEILEDVTEENAFEALAAMMREADVEGGATQIYKDTAEENTATNVDEHINSESDKIALDETVDSKKESTVDDLNTERTNEANDIAGLSSISIEANDDDDKSDEISIENIYERLSEHTSHLIERENQLPTYEKIWLKIKEILGFNFKIKWSYIFIGVLVFVGLSLFNNRYEIVRKAPFMNGLYKVFGIKAKIAGEGLEFQNVTWDYVIDDNIKKMEIKGFISNIVQNSVEIPLVHIEILDANTGLLQSLNKEVKEKELVAGNRAALQVVIENPAPTAKYIYLTFIDKE